MSDWFEQAGRGKPVDLQALFDSRAADLLWAIAAAGALVSVGTTSDGGAVGVTVTRDGRWRREYFRDTDELVTWLSGAYEAVSSWQNDVDASTARRRRSRRP
jgi:hypothetical protein